MKPKKAGRPKKYTDEFLIKLGKELINFMLDKNNIWLKDFCIQKGFYSGMLADYAKENKQFSEALKKAKEIQESKFVKLGLSKKTNPAFVIFTLKNIANWRDKQETELQFTDLKKVKEEIKSIFE